MAEQLGDDHQVGPATHERGRERVPEDVDGRVVAEARRRGDAGDDVVRAADAEPLPPLVEEQRGTVVGAGPVAALGEPARERGMELWVDRDVADAFAFAEDPQDAFAGGAGDVVEVKRDDLADPRAGVERDQRERQVAWRGTGLNGSEVAELGACVERAGRGGRDLDAGGARGSEAAADVEVVDGGERVVDGRGAALEEGLEVRAVVAYRPVAAGGACERVLVEVRGGEPRKVLANFRGLCAARLIGQRR